MHASNRPWRVPLGLALLIAAALLAMFGLAQSPASAATIPGAIKNVTVTPAKPDMNGPVTVNLSWCVPDGSAQGDTFTLTLPPQLIPFTSGFPLKDAAGDVVANAVVKNGVVTFTLTDFVATHTGVCGTAFFNEAIDKNQVTIDQPNTLTFKSDSDLFTSTITPTQGTGSSRTRAVKYGVWVDKSDQGVDHPDDALFWFIDSPLAPAAGFTKVVWDDTASAGQAFDCAKVHVQIGVFSAKGDFVSQGAYTGPVNVACTPSALTVTAGAVPAGKALHLLVPVNITDPTLTKYSDTADVAVDGQPAQVVKAQDVLRFSAGGSASGTGTPVTKPTTSAAGTSAAAPTSAVQASSADQDISALANTGFSGQRTTMLGAGLLLVGGALLLATGRRRKGSHV